MRRKFSRKKRGVRNWQLLIAGIVVLLTATYFLPSNSQKAKLDIPSRTIFPTTTPIPTKFPTIKPSSTPEPTHRSVDWQSLTIPEDELIAAVNNYRQSQGVSRLNVNEGLCQEAKKRAQDLTDQNIGRWPFLLGHEPFLQDVKDGILGKLSGLTFFGENVASSNCKKLTDGGDVFVHNATQLVEECFASSSEHRDNMLRSDWTHVCSSGRYPFYVQIFGR